MIQTCPKHSDLPPDAWAAHLVAVHVDGLADATMATICTHFQGVYATRPTSWMAAMARNPALDLQTAVAMETDPGLVRVPGMRRSKFLVPESLAGSVFAAPQLPLAAHEWRLTEAGTSLDAYRARRADLVACAAAKPQRLADLRAALSLDAKATRAMVTVAGYEGVLVRSAPPNEWSNRWWYSAAPEALQSPPARADALAALARGYLRAYGPVRGADLAWWLGVSNGQAAELISACDAVEVVPGLWLDASQAPGFEARLAAQPITSRPEVRFLPAWDPLSMGYAPGGPQREALRLEAIGGYDAAGNGLPVVLYQGRAVTTWRTRLAGKTRLLEVALDGLNSGARSAVAIAADAWAARLRITNTNSLQES